MAHADLPPAAEGAPAPAFGAPARTTHAPFPLSPAAAEKRALDLEIKDASLIFEAVWAELEREREVENLVFPREIIWLNGAPGAGKGTQTRLVMELRGYTAGPVQVSALLDSPEARRLKDAGMMVGDKEVTALVLRELLNPAYDAGVVVDGYPRTKVQVECLKLLYQRLVRLRNDHRATLLVERFHKPVFQIVVLYVDEAESVRRQVLRGQQMLEHNEEVRQTGMGELIEVRATDLSEDAARNRYRTFKDVTYEALKSLRQLFHYHFINAHGTIDEVQERIERELAYQSTLELEEATLDAISLIPVASELVKHSRQELVSRLDDYQRSHPDLFRRVIDTVEKKFIPIVKRHAISGMAFINSEDDVFDSSLALAMFIDVFSERGFHAVADVHRIEIPERVDPKTFRIHTRVKKVYRFRISFPGSEIRRGV